MPTELKPPPAPPNTSQYAAWIVAQWWDDSPGMVKVKLSRGTLWPEAEAQAEASREKYADLLRAGHQHHAIMELVREDWKLSRA